MTIVNFVRTALGAPKMSSVEARKDYTDRDVSSILSSIQTLLEKQMSALTDLQAAVTAVVNEISSLRSQLAAVPQPSSVSDADAETLASTLNTAVNPPAVAPVEAPVTPAAPETAPATATPAA